MNSRKKIIVLGATGSIGTSALDIARHYPERFEVVAVSAHRNEAQLRAISDEFGSRRFALSGRDGAQAIDAMIRECEADIVVNGIAGASGLSPSIAALESGKDLALANKETIVMAGSLIRKLAEKRGRKILPVDSEHSAVFSLIESQGKENVAEIVLTASGGPFRTWSNERLREAKPEDALKHPTWNMGAKITIDSASLANKGLEVIEACRLFDVPPERVKVVVHPQSLVHSFVRTVDGVLYAQISPPDMRHPILSALSWPERVPNYLEELAFDRICTMHFEPPRYSDFPLLGLAYRAAGLSGKYTIAYNAANEVAVAAFLDRRLSFPGIAATVADTLDGDWSGEPQSHEEIILADAMAREKAEAAIKGHNE